VRRGLKEEEGEETSNEIKIKKNSKFHHLWLAKVNTTKKWEIWEYIQCFNRIISG
jgi:hypothetical protein